MAISAGYVARETGGNIRRNLLMTVAAMVTMALSLSALGGVFVMRQAIKKAEVMTEGNVQVAIFLNPAATTNQTAAIRQELTSTPGVKTFHYVNKQEAYTEFKQIFGSNNDLVSVLGVQDMPTSYRVVPDRTQDVEELGRQFSNQPGVMRVSYPKEAVKALTDQFNRWSVLGYTLSVLVLGLSIVLIVTTIQLAIYARRREIGVMKLVGATNWFIRVPFMMEGLVQGVTGAAIAFGVTYGLRNWIASFLPEQTLFGNSALYVTSGEAIITGVWLLIIGAVVGAIGSVFAAERYLSV